MYDLEIAMQGNVQPQGNLTEVKRMHFKVLLFNLQFNVKAASILQESEQSEEGDKLRRSVVGPDQLAPV
jgi:hypothetical protein